MSLPPKASSRAVQDSKAFTLIELLAAVLIIGILCALLYPAVQRGIVSAKKAKCLTNLKTIGVALLQYAGDNRGNFPYKEGQASHNSPLVLVGGLVGTKGISGYIPWNGNPSATLWSDVFLCPGDPNRALYEKSLGYPGSYIYRQNQEAGDVATGLNPIRLTTKRDNQHGYRRWIVMDRGILGIANLVRPYEGGTKALAQPVEWWEPDRRTYKAYWHLDGVNVLAEDGSASWRAWGETVGF